MKRERERERATGRAFNEGYKIEAPGLVQFEFHLGLSTPKKSVTGAITTKTTGHRLGAKKDNEIIMQIMCKTKQGWLLLLLLLLLLLR